MHISSVELKNVRQFGRKPLSFQPGFNLLVGENGAGKSTVLRALLTALRATGNFSPAERLSEEDIKHRTEELRIDIEIQDSNSVRTLTYAHHWRDGRSYREKLKNVPVIWFGANEASSRSFLSKKVRQYSRKGRERHWDREFRFREEFLWEMMHPDFPEEERSPGEFGRSEHVRRFVAHILSNFSGKFSRFAWRSLPYDCVVRLPKSENIDRRVAAEFRRAVQGDIMRYLEYGLTPKRYRGWGTRRVVRYDARGRPYDAKDEKEIRSMHEFENIVQQSAREFAIGSAAEKAVIELKLDHRITVFGPDGPFYFRQLSDGEKRIFSMFVDIARHLTLRNKNWKDLGKRNAIVAIDEIDCHLHPKWQRMIVSGLEDTFPECQFIVTTHSPFVIQAVDPKKLTQMDASFQETNERSGNSIEDIVEEVQGINMPQRSKRAEEMDRAAERYFTLLRQGKDASAADLENAERAYRLASEPFTTEPGLNALLKLESVAAKAR